MAKPQEVTIKIDPLAVYLLADAADVLHLHVKTVREACVAGRLPGKKAFGRWHLAGKALLDYFSEPTRPEPRSSKKHRRSPTASRAGRRG